MTRDPVIRSERLTTLLGSLRGTFEVTVRGTDENLGVQISWGECDFVRQLLFSKSRGKTFEDRSRLFLGISFHFPSVHPGPFIFWKVIIQFYLIGTLFMFIYIFRIRSMLVAVGWFLIKKFLISEMGRFPLEVRFILSWWRNFPIRSSCTVRTWSEPWSNSHVRQSEIWCMAERDNRHPISIRAKNGTLVQFYLLNWPHSCYAKMNV